LIDFDACRNTLSEALDVYCSKWCNREHAKPEALFDWKKRIFALIDRRISFYQSNNHLLPHKPKLTYRHLKNGIQDFHSKFVFVPADKASNNVIII
jgi:hypothetical protein